MAWKRPEVRGEIVVAECERLQLGGPGFPRRLVSERLPARALGAITGGTRNQFSAGFLGAGIGYPWCPLPYGIRKRRVLAPESAIRFT